MRDGLSHLQQNGTRRPHVVARGLTKTRCGATFAISGASWSFRSPFGCTNIRYRAAGRDWNTLIRERIFAPLGMRESCTASDSSCRCLASLAKRMVTLTVDGSAKVVAMKIENFAEFVRQPAKQGASR